MTVSVFTAEELRQPGAAIDGTEFVFKKDHDGVQAEYVKAAKAYYDLIDRVWQIRNMLDNALQDFPADLTAEQMDKVHSAKSALSYECQKHNSLAGN